MRFGFDCLVVAAALVVSGCGGGSSTPPPPAAPTVSSVTPASGATNVAVTSAVTATFSEAMTASTLATSTFTLTPQGGSAVAGTVTYNSATSTATFTPSANLASNTQYAATITTGATASDGTALASNYTWSFTTAAGPAPTITGFTPANTTIGVSVSTTVTATFSEAMNQSTITASTFTLAGPGGTAVTGTIGYDSTSFTATFTPSAALSYNTIYTATVTTGVVASDGTALAGSNSWSFTTSGPPAPTVTAVTPANASTGVAITTTATATFSEALSASTLTTSTFTLTPQGGSAVTGTVTYDSSSMTATFTPSTTLNYNTQYTATLTTGVVASDGTALAQNYTWSFTTMTQPPTVTVVTPANASTGVAVAATVTATFSQVMNSSTISASTFTLSAQGGAAVTGSVSYNSTTSVATFTPSQNLTYDTAYTATVTTGASSSGGIALAQNYSWSFTTTTAPAPSVTTTVPANGATNVIASDALTATFSQPMNASTLTASTFTLAATGGAAVSGTVAYNAGTSTATFTPGTTLAYSTSYTATITTGATSSAGAQLAANFVWTFTTGTAPSATTVDFGTTYQTIRGFGGSTAWLGPLTTQQATALFSPTICTGSNAGSCGLGLSILRMRIDPEGSPSGGGTYGSPYETGEWDQELTNAQEAVAANPNAIAFATPWTPPASMKTDATVSYSSCGGEGVGYCGGSLNTADYGAYAQYLEDFVTFFNANAGFNLYAISMQNEPEENVTYESCVWTPDQMETWIDALTTPGPNPLTVPLIMPESAVFNSAFTAPALTDSAELGNIGIIGGHLYAFGEGVGTPGPYPDAATYNKPIWMTEHYQNATGTITDALGSAEEVHNSLVNGQYNAYVWWWIWNDPNDGVNYGLINSSTTSPTPTNFGYGIGQFSDFIQPGYVRASATASPTSNVYVSAYTGNGHYVIVAINAGSSAPSLAFTLQNASGVTTLTPYETTSSGGLMQQPAVSVSGGQFTYTLPAQSITTLVQ